MVEVAENEAIKQRAAHLLEEQKDEMKRMNQMMLYSQCVAVRSGISTRQISGLHMTQLQRGKLNWKVHHKARFLPS